MRGGSDPLQGLKRTWPGSQTSVTCVEMILVLWLSPAVFVGPVVCV